MNAPLEEEEDDDVVCLSPPPPTRSAGAAEAPGESWTARSSTARSPSTPPPPPRRAAAAAGSSPADTSDDEVVCLSPPPPPSATWSGTAASLPRSPTSRARVRSPPPRSAPTASPRRKHKDQNKDWVAACAVDRPRDGPAFVYVIHSERRDMVYVGEITRRRVHAGRRRPRHGKVANSRLCRHAQKF